MQKTRYGAHTGPLTQHIVTEVCPPLKEALRGREEQSFPGRTLHIHSMPSGKSEFKGRGEISEALTRLEDRTRASD
jgi:hypothetical protein